MSKCEHRQCARHVYASIKKKFSGAEYKKLFWFAAKATTTTKFEDIMKEIKLIDKNAYEHLMEKNQTHGLGHFLGKIVVVMPLKMVYQSHLMKLLWKLEKNQ